MGRSRENVLVLGGFNQRPSNLRLEITPQSPFEPILGTLSATPSSPVATNSLSKASPPPLPVAWQWSCHKCGGTFPLGATRRCLYDGHTFCSGFEVNKKTKKVRKNSPCGSVFDYVGWRAWADWREEGLLRRSPEESSPGEEKATKRKRDCEHNCTFPSECRWGPLFQDDSKSQQKKSKKQSSSEKSKLNNVAGPTSSSPSPPSPGSPPSPPSTNSSPKRTSPVSPLDNPNASKQEINHSLFAKLLASTERRHETLTAEVSATASGLTSFKSIESTAIGELQNINLGPSPDLLTPPSTPQTRAIELPAQKSSKIGPISPPTPAATPTNSPRISARAPLIGLAISPGIESSIPRNIDAPTISPGTEEAAPRSPTFAQTFPLPTTSIPIWAVENIAASLNDSVDITDVTFGSKDPPSPLSETFDLNRVSWYAGDDGCAKNVEEDWDWSTGGFRNSGSFGIGLQGEMELISVDDCSWI